MYKKFISTCTKHLNLIIQKLCTTESAQSDASLAYTLLIPSSEFARLSRAKGGSRHDEPISYPVFVGVRQLHEQEAGSYSRANSTLPKPYTGEQAFTVNYTIQVFSSNCFFQNVSHKSWSSNGCHVLLCLISLLIKGFQWLSSY